MEEREPRPLSAVEGGYWVVIPAYNEADTVCDVARRALQQCPHIVVIDDGSVDGTAQVLADLDVTVLRNEQNCGKAASLLRGFDYALAQGAAFVITLDADGQHAPEEIPLFIQASITSPDSFWIGARHRRQRRASLWRYAANRIADFWIGWAAGQRIQDSQSGFRLYPARLINAVKLPHDRLRSFVYESEMVIEAARRGFACRNLAVSVSPRAGPRPSHFRPLADILRITRMVAWKLLSRGLYLQGLYRYLLCLRDVQLGHQPVTEGQPCNRPWTSQ